MTGCYNTMSMYCVHILLLYRWIINLAMDTAAKIFRVDTKVDCMQLNEVQTCMDACVEAVVTFSHREMTWELVHI